MKDDVCSDEGNNMEMVRSSEILDICRRYGLQDLLIDRV